MRKALQLLKDQALSPRARGDDHVEYTLLLLKCEPADLRDPATALQHAKRAVELSPANPHFLDVLAQAYSANGDKANAVRMEEQALALITQQDAYKGAPGLRKELETNLARFRAASATR